MSLSFRTGIAGSLIYCQSSPFMLPTAGLEKSYVNILSRQDKSTIIKNYKR